MAIRAEGEISLDEGVFAFFANVWVTASALIVRLYFTATPLTASSNLPMTVSTVTPSGAQTGTPTDPLVDEVGRVRLLGAGSGGEAHGVANQIRSDGNFADYVVKAQHVFAGEQRLNGLRFAAGGLFHDFDFIVLRQVINHHVEHEAIQLCFG